MSPTANRAAFTLIELIVVIAIIGILIVLILPAVQQTREAARRTQCKNNLKQLALALHYYHDAHGMFPINYGFGGYDSTNTGASWMQMALPYIEQHNLYDDIRFGAPLSDSENSKVAKSVVPLFLCASDTNNGQMDFRANVPGMWAVQNYKACAGSNWEWGEFSPVTSTQGRYANNPDGLDHSNGLIGRNGQLDLPGRILVTSSLGDVTDGASMTFAIGEAVPEWCRHTWWWWFNATTATCAIPLNYKQQPDRQISIDGDWWHNYSFLSRHSGGGQFALVDGSVRFVSDAIDLEVYRGLGTIQGQEVTELP